MRRWETTGNIDRLVPTIPFGRSWLLVGSVVLIAIATAATLRVARKLGSLLCLFSQRSTRVRLRLRLRRRHSTSGTSELRARMQSRVEACCKQEAHHGKCPGAHLAFRNPVRGFIAPTVSPELSHSVESYFAGLESAAPLTIAHLAFYGVTARKRKPLCGHSCSACIRGGRLCPPLAPGLRVTRCPPNSASQKSLRGPIGLPVFPAFALEGAHRTCQVR